MLIAPPWPEYPVPSQHGHPAYATSQPFQRQYSPVGKTAPRIETQDSPLTAYSPESAHNLKFTIPQRMETGRKTWLRQLQANGRIQISLDLLYGCWASHNPCFQSSTAFLVLSHQRSPLSRPFWWNGLAKKAGSPYFLHESHST